ncbi:MAG TPA: redox-regulated ATPase YchF [Solirubrobacteraceae bacterium]|nr:redox-regulated ATPase YchF [Solirubrobacteraceae bacterium]
MRVGIVGLPNAGKSSLFNALTGAGAEAANYPFTTIEPNVAVVPVADERLVELAKTLKADPVIPDTIQFHDIAGLIAGAHRGEGLGNRFLAHIRETDAILHVVRAHGDPSVVHPDGQVDPVADAEVVEAELLLADLEQAERRLERVERTARGGQRSAVAEERWLRELIAALGAGQPARDVPPPADAPDAVRQLGPLTAKPVLFVVNVDEGSAEIPPALLEHAVAVGARVVAVPARLEAELAELDPSESDALREELGAPEPGLPRVIAEAFALLDLIAFFTADQARPAQSWHVPRGATALDAAGEIHTDMRRGFVRAEVVSWRELVSAGGYAAARDRGTLRIEGRDYVLTDGDVLTIKFTP